MKMLSAVILALPLICLTTGLNPAVQVILNNKGLQYGKHVGAGWVQDKLKDVTLPDITGDIPLLWSSISYTLSGINIKQCDFPEPSVEFFEDATGFKTSISGLDMALAGRWKTHYGFIHDGGSFDLAIFNVDVTSVLGLGKDDEGRVSVTSVSCDAQVGNVNVHFHGGASWMFRPFVSHFTERIRDKIRDNICPSIEESIVDLEDHLQTVKVSFNVTQDLTLDLPLTTVPAIEAASLHLGLKGEFYSSKTHSEPPFKAQPFTMPQQTGYMLSVGLSEFTLNSAAYGYYSAGLLQALINDSMIPPSSPLHLNTSLMGPFVPQLPKLFPGLLMNLLVYAREAPFFSLESGAVRLSVPAAVKAFAIQPNGTQTPLFKLNVDSAFSGKVWVADGKLKGSMAMNNLTLTLAGTEVGTFKTDALANVAKMGSLIGIAKVNQKLGQGIDLPRMKNAVLVNSVLAVDKGFIALSSDAQVLLGKTPADKQ
ncbi:uncharacterized protein V6R79_014286 [Siganus canaliculatus]